MTTNLANCVRTSLRGSEAISPPKGVSVYGPQMVGANLTYDGKLIVLTTGSIHAVDRNFQGKPDTILFGGDEYVSNSMSIDEKGGIYVASDSQMHRIVWTGSKLSMDEADGAWSSAYDFGREPPSVKFGRGTGSTPTLMGFGNDPDKLVVIIDGSDRMKVVGFWREAIPSDFQQQPGTKSRRIAGQIEITCGLSNASSPLKLEPLRIRKPENSFSTISHRHSSPLTFCAAYIATLVIHVRKEVGGASTVRHRPSHH